MRRLRAIAAAFIVTTLCFAGSPAHAFYNGNGFNLDEEHAILPEYTVRLVGPVEYPLLRAEVQRSVDQMVAITGITVTVAPDLVLLDRAPVDGEILVAVSPDSGCPQVNSLGCEQSYRGERGPRSGVLYHMASKVTIATAAFGYNLRHVVIHEMGHAFGLQHYNSVFDGSRQVMYDTTDIINTVDSYQSGDANGFLFQRDFGA